MTDAEKDNLLFRYQQEKARNEDSRTKMNQICLELESLFNLTGHTTPSKSIRRTTDKHVVYFQKLKYPVLTNKNCGLELSGITKDMLPINKWGNLNKGKLANMKDKDPLLYEKLMSVGYIHFREEPAIIKSVSTRNTPTSEASDE